RGERGLQVVVPQVAFEERVADEDDAVAVHKLEGLLRGLEPEKRQQKKVFHGDATPWLESRCIELATDYTSSDENRKLKIERRRKTEVRRPNPGKNPPLLRPP